MYNSPTLKNNNKFMKKQKMILLVTVVAFIILFMSSSYAILTNFDKTDEVVTISSGNLAMSVNNVAGLINLANRLPESDSEGLINSTPVVLALTNTGSIEIMKYDVKLISDSNHESTLSTEYIKYSISLDGGNTYSEPAILSSTNDVIYTGYTLAANEGITLYLKIWIDEHANNDVLGKTYYGSVQVELYQNAEVPLNFAIKNATLSSNNDNCKTYVKDIDNIIYLSGNKECMNFNYVWYSGKLWQVVAINPNGTIKMISADNVTNLKGLDNKFQWLNEDFLDTLHNYQNIVDTNAIWNYSLDENETPINPFEIENQETVTSSVGMLNAYEYSKMGSYLNNNTNWWLSTPYNLESMWNVSATGALATSSLNSAYGIRPVINVLSSIMVSEGRGTKTSPYVILSDNVGDGDLLNTRMSGEYVDFNNDLYRIVTVDNNMTKIVRVDYLRSENKEIMKKRLASTIYYGNNSNVQSDDYWDYYLNNIWYNSLIDNYRNMIESGTYYLDEYTANYKGILCQNIENVTTKNCQRYNQDNANKVYVGNIGLLRAGEMWSTQLNYDNLNPVEMFLITSNYNVNANGDLINNDLNDTYGVRPAFYLKANVRIVDGLGTRINPYKINIQ